MHAAEAAFGGVRGTQLEIVGQRAVMATQANGGIDAASAAQAL